MFNSKLDLRIKTITLPFTEFIFYENDLFEQLVKSEEKSTEVINNIYKTILKTQKINNLEEVNLIIDKFYNREELKKEYKKNKSITRCYIDILSKMSKYFITHRNGNICFKYWESDGEKNFLGPYKGIYKIAVWNSLNRMFTTDILVMLYFLNNNMDDERVLSTFHSLVKLEDLQLEQVLKKGLSENHLHMNAGGNFVSSWMELMSLNKLDFEEKKALIKIDKLIGDDKNINLYVKAMCVVRIVLALFLTNKDSGCSYDFKGFLTRFNDLENYNENLWYKIQKLIYIVLEGKALNEEYLINNVADIYEELKIDLDISECINGDYRWNEVLVKRDVINSIINKGDYTDTNVENIFLFKSLKYIKNTLGKEEDKFFSKLFFKYIIIKNEVFRSKVQYNSIKGLEYFSDYYNRSTDTNLSKKEAIGLILHNQFKNSNFKKIELRCVVKGQPHDKNYMEIKTKAFLREFFEVYLELLKEEEKKRGNSYPNIGLVFHFIKKQESNMPEKCWMNYKNNDENKFLQFAEHKKEYEAQLKFIQKLRRNSSILSKYIVGIDAASVESYTEPWVFADIYDKARDSKDNSLINLCDGEVIENLGFTFHAGEDFNHIISGLRRVDEVIDKFKFHSGDRIGHGIALGLDVGKWIDENRIVIMKRIEYLENLIWIWGLYKEEKYSINVDYGYLERMILECAEEVYGKNMDGITTYNLWKAYEMKFKPNEVLEKYKEVFNSHYGNVFCPSAQEINPYNDLDYKKYLWDEDKLLLSYNCKCYLKKMIEPIEVEVTKEEIRLITDIQKLILKKVSKKGIVIETNPTSNRVIGEISSVLEHYITNLNQRGLTSEIRDENGIVVTINSDDPSVFNTCLSNEFAYIFYSLLEKGYNREDALQWIDRIRDNGVRTSFVKEDGLSLGEKIEEIKEILRVLSE